MHRTALRFFVLVPFAALALPASPRVEAQQPRENPPPRQQQPAANKAAGGLAVAPDPARMREILAEWERLSSQLRSVEVEIKRFDKDAAWGDETFVGLAMFQSPNLAWLNFKKETPNPKTGKLELVDHERIICTGTDVWQYVVAKQQIFVFPLDKKDQKHALEEGPLPFLFNLKAAEAEERYTMQLLDEKQDYFIIGVLPRLKVDKAAFSYAMIRLVKKNYFPDRIILVAPDGKGKKDFTLQNLKPNKRINPANFKGAIYPKPWTVVRDIAPEPERPAPAARLGQGEGQRPMPAAGGGAARPR